MQESNKARGGIRVNLLEIGPLSYQLTEEQRNRWLGTLYDRRQFDEAMWFEPSGVLLNSDELAQLAILLITLDEDTPNRTAILRSERE